MLDQLDIEQKLSQWMIEFLEEPNPMLGSWAPCPYARQARIANKLAIILSSIDLTAAIEKAKQLLEDKDVVVVAFDHTLISHYELTLFVKTINEQLMQDDYVVLRDHPDDAEYINTVKMNFGHCGLLMIQRLSKLKQASEQLLAKGYYQNWDTIDYHNMVDWRK